MLSSDDQRWCHDTIAQVISDMERNVAEMEDYDWSIDIATQCYFRALGEVTTPNPNTTYEDLLGIVEKAMDRALEYWDYICATLDASYEGFQCQRWGLVSVMLLIVTGAPKLPHNRALRQYLTTTGAAKYEKRFLVDVNHEGYEALSDEEITELTKDMDDNLLKEFFELFADLKMFHGNSKDYGDDAESVKKQRKLLAVYEKLFRSKNQN